MGSPSHNQTITLIISDAANKHPEKHKEIRETRVAEELISEYGKFNQTTARTDKNF